MKSFWAKPEGTTGMIVGVGLLIAAAIGLSAILPFIINLLQNAITAAALIAVLSGMLYVALDRRFRTLLSYGYKSIMRWVTARFVELDPIGILKSYVASLRQSLEEMGQQMANLQGQIDQLKDEIEKNTAKEKAALRLAAKAQETKQRKVLVLQARQAGRLQESNITYQALLAKMEGLFRVLEKMREVSEFVLQDIESEVEVQTRKYRLIQAGYSAFKSAVRILKGDADQREIFEQAMNFLAESYAAKLGEIKAFMEVSEGFISSVDLENQVYEEDAMRMLAEWETKADQVFMSVQEDIPALQTPLEALTTIDGTDSGREVVPAVRSHEPQYDDLFRDDKEPR